MAAESDNLDAGSGFDFSFLCDPGLDFHFDTDLYLDPALLSSKVSELLYLTDIFNIGTIATAFCAPIFPIVELLHSHTTSQSYWSSGSTVCFPPRGAAVRPGGGGGGETHVVKMVCTV